ncbi:hypothetical protein WJX72_007689 [[Myrmecia] bisecta]|uniref:Transmembrane protein n=1 Tax=[Myrmecia] bisecta TaxID=41462 RepID=A0AAW1PXL5_9CHLO
MPVGSLLMVERVGQAPSNGRSDPAGCSTIDPNANADLLPGTSTSGSYCAAAANIPISALTFNSKRDEVAFMAYVGKQAQSFAVRLVLVQAFLWAVGACLVIHWLLTSSLSPNCLTRYLIVMTAQLVAVTKLACIWRRVSSPSWQVVLHEELMMSDLLWQTACAIPCVLMLKPGQMRFTSALDSMATIGLWSAFDYLRLDTAIKFHAILALCFVGLEADAFLQPGSVLTMSQVVLDALRYMATGTVLPLLIAVSMEARLRQMFVLCCCRPGTQLGSFWERIIALQSLFMHLTRHLSALCKVGVAKNREAEGGNMHSHCQ